jgi:hypothetical protein
MKSASGAKRTSASEQSTGSGEMMIGDVLLALAVLGVVILVWTAFR